MVISGVSITIGIPTYLGFHTLARTVDSVVGALKQLSPAEMEIIICVNGEASKTLTIANGCRKKYPGLVRVQWKKKQNKAGAMNYIVEYAQGDIIFFIDDDILLEPECLRQCYLILHKSEKIKLVFANMVNIDNIDIGDLNPYRRFCYLVFTLRYRKLLYSRSDGYVRGACMGMRRKDFPWFPEDLINDDQYLHILFWGHVHKVPEAIFYAYGVSSIRQYCRRYYRIASGRQQMYHYFSPHQVYRYETLIHRVPDIACIKKLTVLEKIQFYTWRLLDWTARWSFRLWGKHRCEWHRTSHDHQFD